MQKTFHARTKAARIDEERRVHAGRSRPGGMSRNPNPVTPLPSMPSLAPLQVARSTPFWGEDDIASIPTSPQTSISHQESVDYIASSSLSALTLLKSKPQVTNIDEIDTQPPRDLQELEAQFQTNYRLAAIDTVPAAPLLMPGQRSSAQPTFVVQPLEGLRWWLLRPGHIEFLLWSAGTILLTCISGFFLLTLVVGLGMVH